MTSDQICILLQRRHANDVFVTECKDGPSQCVSDFRRLDAWAMKRSWVNPCMWGYEIKVSRRDFVQDQKWPTYLHLCNEFYFVAPKGVIRVEELPDNVGLLHVASTGSRLMVARKAKRREVKPPVSLFVYLLFSRATFTHEGREAVDRESRVDFWRRWLEDKERSLDIGHRVSRSLSALIEKRIRDVEAENRAWREKILAYDGVLHLLKQLGIEDDSLYNMQNRVRRQITALQAAFPEMALGHMKAVHLHLGQLIERLAQEK